MVVILCQWGVYSRWKWCGVQMNKNRNWFWQKVETSNGHGMNENDNVASPYKQLDCSENKLDYE